MECSKWKRDPWASFEKKKSDRAWHDWSFAGAMDSGLWMLWTLWTFCGWGWDHRLDIMSGTCPHNPRYPRHHQVTTTAFPLLVPLLCPDALSPLAILVFGLLSLCRSYVPPRPNGPTSSTNSLLRPPARYNMGYFELGRVPHHHGSSRLLILLAACRAIGWRRREIGQ